MTKQEYQKRLDKLLEDYFFPEDVGRNESNDEYLRSALQAICLLNEEAIGADMPEEANGEPVIEQWFKNHLRKELRTVIGTSNEN